MFFGVFDRLQSGSLHRLPFLAAHQIRAQHQRRRAGDHLFRNAFRAQLVHLARVDGEGALAAFANQRETAADGAINALQIVKIGTAGGIAQVTVGIAADFHVAAHHAEQHRAIVRQHRIVVHGIADGAAGELMGNQVVFIQFLIQRLGDVVFNHQRVAQAQAVALDKSVVHFRLDIHQRLIDADDIRGADFTFGLGLLQKRIAGAHREIVFGLAFTRKFHVIGGGDGLTSGEC